MRRLVALSLLCGIVAMPLVALAQAADEGPVVDVVEVAGIIDRPMASYLTERIEEAERDQVALLVIQVDSLGGLKVAGGSWDPRVRLARATVPVAVFVGPRRAHAAGLALELGANADLLAAGPSSRLGPAVPDDFASPSTPRIAPCLADERCGGFPVDVSATRIYTANEALDVGLADFVVPSVADLLVRADGRTVQTPAGSVRLDLPRDDLTVRFFQPGPIRRLLHTFANPTLVYLLLIGGALLIVFELFQPGFGVAGVTGGLLLVAAAYGLTVLPARWYGLALLVAGLLLLTLDVAIDGLGPPTIAGATALGAGSMLLLPNTADPVRLSPWLVGPMIAACLIFFVPAMTVVRRARRPIATAAKARLVGEPGQVRSMLNPEGFVMVDGEVWRARSQDGSRVRVGEDVVVHSVDGTVLIVKAPVQG